MKPIKSTFLSILLIGTGVAHAMDGYLTDSTFWTYGYLDEYAINRSMTSKSLYSLEGDTVINEKLYRKVVTENGYVGGIREEGTKWFAVIKYLRTTEALLYDFSYNLGDTIDAPGSEGYTKYHVIVTKVDSIMLENGVKRKRLVINNDYTWIEGVGDIESLFDPIEPTINWKCMPRCVDCISPQSVLVCFKQDGVVLYSDLTYCTDCCAYKGPEDLDRMRKFKGLRWLLTKDGLLDYQLPDGPQVIKNAKLMNLSGMTVWEARAGFEEAGGRISISHLPHGIYMLRVSTARGVVMEKVSW